MRCFEKISYEQFKKDLRDDLELYNSYELPIRKTKNSAGYDFEVIESFTLKPGEIKKVPTGVKVQMYEDEMLMLIIRSGVGFKYNVRLTNQVGIIESDYYDNESNEGHIWLSIQNESNVDVSFEKGNSFCQGIFAKFLIIDNEKKIENIRKGGIGSTTKGDEV